MKPDASIVIVSWNGRRFLDACLTAVAAQEGVVAETILVDNASTDGTAEYVRRAYPWVTLVSLPENRGFAGGNNAGVRAARGRTVVLLNNDTAADPGWLRALVGGIDMAQRFALTTSRVVYMHDPAIVDSAGDGMLRAGGAFKRHHGGPASAVTVSQEVFGVCGAACAMSRAVWDELGGFDERFFFSHEDVDLSYRARLLGYRCRYVADAIVRHHGSVTIGRASAMAVFHGQRNLEWVYAKNTPGGLLWKTLPEHLLYTLAAAMHFGRTGRMLPFLRGKLAALAGLPAVLADRSRVQRTRRVDATAIAELLDTGWVGVKRREKRFDAGI